MVSGSAQSVEALTASEPSLEALATLTRLTHQPNPGVRFRPTHPNEEAHEQALMSGLTGHGVAEDLDGAEQPLPFTRLPVSEPVTAIDCGVVRLGHTTDGMVVASRAAAVTSYPDGRLELETFRPGYLYINRDNRLDVLHAMGKALGRPDFYVETDDDGRPTVEKVEMSVSDHRLADRVRNFTERMVQEFVCSHRRNGAVVLDGALTLRTWDTPQAFLRRLHDTCQERDLSLVAVAKRTGLTIQGVDIRFLIDEPQALPQRRRLTGHLQEEAKRVKAAGGHATGHRALGDLYVARFACGGDAYRVDVAPAPGRLSSRVLDEVVGSMIFRVGYPELLIKAHLFSYFTPPQVAALQAHAIAEYGLVVRPEPNLTAIFAPFGGRFK